MERCSGLQSIAPLAARRPRMLAANPRTPRNNSVPRSRLMKIPLTRLAVTHAAHPSDGSRGSPADDSGVTQVSTPGRPGYRPRNHPVLHNNRDPCVSMCSRALSSLGKSRKVLKPQNASCAHWYFPQSKASVRSRGLRRCGLDRHLIVYGLDSRDCFRVLLRPLDILRLPPQSHAGAPSPA